MDKAFAALLQVAKSVVYVHEHSGPNAQFILRGLVDDARAAILLAEPDGPAYLGTPNPMHKSGYEVDLPEDPDA